MTINGGGYTNNILGLLIMTSITDIKIVDNHYYHLMETILQQQ